MQNEKGKFETYWKKGKQCCNNVYTRTFWKSNGADNGFRYVGTVYGCNGMNAVELIKVDSKYTNGYTLID